MRISVAGIVVVVAISVIIVGCTEGGRRGEWRPCEREIKMRSCPGRNEPITNNQDYKGSGEREGKKEGEMKEREKQGNERKKENKRKRETRK